MVGGGDRLERDLLLLVRRRRRSDRSWPVSTHGSPRAWPTTRRPRRTRVDGKQTFKKLDGVHNLTEAKQARIQLLAKLGKGELTTPTKLTLADVEAEWYGQLNARRRTLENYEYHWRKNIEPVLGRRRVQDLRSQDVVALGKKMLADGKSPATVTSARGVVSAILSFAVYEKYVLANVARQKPPSGWPETNVAKKAKKPFLTSAELEVALAELSESYHGPMYLAAWTGCRISEVLGLTWGDVNFQAQPVPTISVSEQLERGTLKRGVTKTENSVREVDLTPKVIAFLKAHRAQAFGRHGDRDFVFLTRAGTVMRHGNLTEAWASAQKRAGVGHVTIHSLRGRYGSILFAETGDIGYVASQLGDTPEMCWRRYVKNIRTPEQSAKGIAGLVRAGG